MEFTVFTPSGPRTVEEAGLAALLADSSPFWVDVHEPTADQLAALGRVFGFHEISLEDCEIYSEMPKVEEFNKYLFVVLHGHGYDKESQEFEHRELNLFLTQTALVTVHLDLHVSVETIRAEVEKDPAILSAGSDSLFFRIVDFLAERYLPLLEEWEDDLDALEDRVLAGVSDNIVEEVIAFKRRVIGLRRSINPQREIFRLLSSHENPYITPQVRVYLRDTYDHMYRVHEELEGIRDMLTSLMDAYRSNLSVKMNEVMQKLTIIATIFMPLTFVVGLYGMNVDIPEAKVRHAYFFILGGMALMAYFMVRFFRRKKWL
jgi:magnesium transporter